MRTIVWNEKQKSVEIIDQNALPLEYKTVNLLTYQDVVFAIQHMTVRGAPAGDTANTNTGFFGYSTEDTTLCTGTAGRFQSNKWAGTTTTGQEVACNSGNVTAETTRIGYQAEVNAVQPAGAYTGSVILIATPTY